MQFIKRDADGDIVAIFSADVVADTDMDGYEKVDVAQQLALPPDIRARDTLQTTLKEAGYDSIGHLVLAALMEQADSSLLQWVLDAQDKLAVGRFDIGEWEPAEPDLPQLQ